MYNRDYLTDQTNSYSNESSKQEYIMSFLKATYQLFAGSLLAATAGAYIGLGIVNYIAGPMMWVLFAIELALIFFVIPRVKHTPGVNLAVLFVFTFITGLTIAPLLTAIFAMPGGASIVGQAFLMTSIAFGGISMFAMTTKKDYGFMGKFLFIALIIMIVAGISNIFIQSSMMQLVIASAGALLFSAFILYDTQNIIKGNYDSPVEAALSLYLDFFNLFISLLQILGIMKNNE
ncbi:Bax inhibitor-1/YccA family protein [Aliarcobacter skirrowii]|uniref:Bax inhibitor-1/YccA family protein n=1 Tax=Aliarcobacter skirrowii TaxID=28200 RepID=UPI0029A46A93|nr:Bax inhibitor-1/YccA family protein [Aliarcobacter skirrowii]MDX4070080.1 Bax inhibitor-1/YccA family protein [Aliarcobacter skirrowii]